MYVWHARRITLYILLCIYSSILLEFLKNVTINRDSVLRVLEKRFVLNYKYKTMYLCCSTCTIVYACGIHGGIVYLDETPLARPNRKTLEFISFRVIRLRHRGRSQGITLPVFYSIGVSSL